MPMPTRIIPTSNISTPSNLNHLRHLRPRPFSAGILDIPYNKMPHPTNNMMMPLAVVIIVATTCENTSGAYLANISRTNPPQSIAKPEAEGGLREDRKISSRSRFLEEAQAG